MWRALKAAIFGRKTPNFAQAPPIPRSPAGMLASGSPSAKVDTTRDGVVKAILAFRTTVKSENAEKIRTAIGPFKETPLVPRELAHDVQGAEAMLAWLSLRDDVELGQPLPVVATMSDGDSCYFRATHVELEQRRDN